MTADIQNQIVLKKDQQQLDKTTWRTKELTILNACVTSKHWSFPGNTDYCS